MQLAHNTLVLVADGRKVLFLRNEGDAVSSQSGRRACRGAASIRPGPRSEEPMRRAAPRAAIGGRQTTMDEVDFHQQEEDRFAADVGAMLKSRALGQRFRSADHRRARQDAGRTAQALSHVEVAKPVGAARSPKDLTGHPPIGPTIESAIKAARKRGSLKAVERSSAWRSACARPRPPPRRRTGRSSAVPEPARAGRRDDPVDPLLPCQPLEPQLLARAPALDDEP